MIVRDLLSVDSERLEGVSPGSVDDSFPPDVLQEATLLKVLTSFPQNSILALIDLRTSLQFREANTAVLAVRGLNRLNWSGDSSEPGRMAWSVMSSGISSVGRNVEVTLDCHPPGQLRIAGRKFAFYCGNVSELPQDPPDYVEDEAAVISRAEPQWESEFRLLYARSVEA
jgi:hypothetical protein